MLKLFVVVVSLCCLVLSAWHTGSAWASESESSLPQSLPCAFEWLQSPSTPFPALVVTLRVFSSTNDPQWILNSTASQVLVAALTTASAPTSVETSLRVLGYQGFLVSCPHSPRGVLIHSNDQMESYLLDDISQRQADGLLSVAGLNEAVLEHVSKSMGHIVALSQRQLRVLSTVPMTAYTVELSAAAEAGRWNLAPSRLSSEALTLPLLSGMENAVQCKVLVVGPDTPPLYDPKHDDGGCFITDQSLNNCYAYGCDIVTDTFPQPGRGSGQKWTENTCENMGAASERDGLVYVGTDLPASQPKNGTGHYVALLIWPDTNFHWIRMDANNDNSTGVPVYYWSHKPGQTAVRNVDNNGELITNPAVSDFSPWTQFCAYYRAQPSVLKID